MAEALKTPHLQIHINKEAFRFDDPHQSGASLKERAGIPVSDTLFLDHAHEDVVIPNDTVVTLKNGESFHSEPPANYGNQPHLVTVHINKELFRFEDTNQSGASLKERASIPVSDTLFLDHAKEDVVIPNEQSITLKNGESFHSEPPANYGKAVIDPEEVGSAPFELIDQPDGWTFLVLTDFQLPDGFVPRTAQVLVKLPPLFPEASPDMFWMNPPVHLTNGVAPHGTSPELLLGDNWQRFSWHLNPGVWRPGVSTLRDFLRCIRGRLERRN
jgi:hypothetical protein